ncbi:MAG TPA: hypothetical protein VIY08_02985 [Candidatus Nitrosocosmicus sp.]
MNNNSFNEILNLTITPNNTITFNLSDFNLSTLYKELLNFYISYELDNKLFFAYPFNENGLLSNKCYISGYIDTYRPLSILTSGFLTDKDIEFFFDLEYQLGTEYAYLYKYNILNLYIILKIALASQVDEESSYESCILEDKSNFFIFISKYDISKSNLETMIDNFYINL